MDERIKLLTSSDLADIQIHLDAALDTDHGSGDHWILMSCLAKYGFRTNRTQEAINLTEEIIVKWHSLQR